RSPEHLDTRLRRFERSHPRALRKRGQGVAPPARADVDDVIPRLEVAPVLKFDLGLVLERVVAVRIRRRVDDKKRMCAETLFDEAGGRDHVACVSEQQAEYISPS